MSNLHTIVLIVHVLIGATIVALVLLQRGKGADAGAAFGAGASGTVFGAKGSANFLSRSTAVLATLFFCTSLGLAYLGTQRQAPPSLMDTVAPAAAAVPTDPAAPAPVDGLPALPSAPAVNSTQAPAANAPAANAPAASAPAASTAREPVEGQPGR